MDQIGKYPLVKTGDGAEGDFFATWWRARSKSPSIKNYSISFRRGNASAKWPSSPRRETKALPMRPQCASRAALPSPGQKTWHSPTSPAGIALNCVHGQSGRAADSRQHPPDRGLTRSRPTAKSSDATQPCSSFCSSPDWYISFMMSEPPTNSPLT